MQNHIVIIGGMGPQASLELHRRILNQAAVNGAQHAHQYPQISHLSVPFPDFISNTKLAPAALDLLSKTARRVYLWRQSSNSYGLQYGSSVSA
jgi:aspartate racemase